MLHLISCVAGVSRFGRDVLLSLSLAKLEQVNARLKRPSLGRGHRFETMAGAIAADEGAVSRRWSRPPSARCPSRRRTTRCWRRNNGAAGVVLREAPAMLLGRGLRRSDAAALAMAPSSGG
jgi:hypothetical protein